MRGSEIPQRPHTGVIPGLRYLAQVPGALVHGARGKAAMLVEECGVRPQGGLDPRRHRVDNRSPDAPAKHAIGIGLKEDAHRCAHESAAARAAPRQTVRDVLLHLPCAHALRQGDPARIAVRGEPQPLPQMLLRNLLQVLATDQCLGDVIDSRFVW
jgi:hypothetical protein